MDDAPEPVPGARTQLIIFDLMGTLIRDEGVVSGAYSSALQEAGMPLQSAEHEHAQRQIEELAGRPTLDVLTSVLEDSVRAEEATWAFDDAILREVDSLVEIEGTTDALMQLTQRGILLAVTTSFSPEVRKAILTRAGWGETFAMELSAHGARRGHPAPDLLLSAILELRVDSVSQVAIVGDNAADLVAGNRAGAGLVIGVRSGTGHPGDLEKAPHTHIIESVAEINSVLEAARTVGARRSSDR